MPCKSLVYIHPELSWMLNSCPIVYHVDKWTPRDLVCFIDVSFDAYFFIVTSKIIENIYISQQNKTKQNKIKYLTFCRSCMWRTRNNSWNSRVLVIKIKEINIIYCCLQKCLFFSGQIEDDCWTKYVHIVWTWSLLLFLNHVTRVNSDLLHFDYVLGEEKHFISKVNFYLFFENVISHINVLR